jgi:hypothetical protein
VRSFSVFKRGACGGGLAARCDPAGSPRCAPRALGKALPTSVRGSLAVFATGPGNRRGDSAAKHFRRDGGFEQQREPLRALEQRIRGA